MDTLTPRPDLTVYYNTRCPVCDAGIGAERSRLLELVREGRVAFRDINLEPDALAHHGADLEAIRRRLHAVDRDGKLVTGADVGLALMLMDRGWRWLATLAGLPVIRSVVRWVYDRFADILYAWNRRKGHW